MDNRLGKRINENISVLFYNDGLPVAVGKTKNVAPGGVFVENVSEPVNGFQYIKVAFVVSHNDIVTKLYHANAHVIHRSEAGVGLMIDNFDQKNVLPMSH